MRLNRSTAWSKLALPLGQPQFTRCDPAQSVIDHPLRLRQRRPACVSSEGDVAFRAQRSLPASFASSAHNSPLLRQARSTRTSAPLFLARSWARIWASSWQISAILFLPSCRQADSAPLPANGCVCRLVHSVKVNVLMKR